MTSADPIARAYAILGLQRGCTRPDVKQQYKRLVRKWHPDRHANDPIGLVEATAEMRRINDAFATLEASVRTTDYVPAAKADRPAPAQSEASAEREPSTYYGRPLSAAEIGRIANAIGRPDPVGFIVDLLSWCLPVVYGILTYVKFRPAATRVDWAWVGVFALIPIAVQIRRRWTGR